MTTTTGSLSKREREALRGRAEELRKEAKRPRGGKAAAEELDVLTKISEMPAPDRALAERIHTIVTEEAPDLRPKLWYGQPAYARGGKVACFFRSGVADGERYSTFGFTPEADLDDDSGMWATSFALTEVTPASAEAIATRVRRALG